MESSILASGDSFFESLTPSDLSWSSLSSSILIPAMTRGPITGPRPASSTPQTRKNTLAPFHPRVDDREYPLYYFLTVITGNLETHCLSEPWRPLNLGVM